MADYGFDTTDLEKLIASLSRAQAPTDEDRSAARSQALQVAGLSLLGTPKGQVWGRAGQAGMNALAAKQNYLADIPKQRQAALQSATQAMSLQEQLRGLQDQQAFQQRLQGGLLTGGGAVPPSSIATPSAPPMGEAGGFSAPGVTPPQAPAQAPAAPPQDYYTKAMQQADALEAFAQSGQPGAQSAAKLARDTREQALKWRDENTGVETVMGPNGPMLIQRRKHGDPTQLPYQPKPDIKEVSTNTEKFFIDPLTNKRYGDNFQMGISPADTQRIALERQRLAQAERHHQDAQNKAGGDDWVNDLDRGIQINKKTGESRQIMAGGTPIGAKEDKITDPQLKARAFHSRMTAASNIIDPLEEGGYTPGWGAAAAKTAGNVPLVGGFTGGVANAVGNYLSGNKMGKYEQAAMDWVRAKLRPESGAVIGPKEMEDEIRTYFPMQGDSAELKKQKAAARKVAEQALAIEAKFKTGGQTSVRSAADRILSGE